MSVSNNPSEEKILEDILTIEKHEDRMITALVQLMASSEKMNRRLSLLTWLMLLLTWITFVISIPNTLATIFSIPQVSQALGMEFMTATLIISTIGALLPANRTGIGPVTQEHRETNSTDVDDRRGTVGGEKSSA